MAAAALITAEQFEQMGHLGRWSELERGVVVPVNPPGFPHGAIAVAIAVRLHAFVQPRGLGAVVVESGFTISRNPDTVRGPDVSFVRRERTGSGRARGYLAAGARLVWLVDPDSTTVQLHAPGAAMRTLTASDVLDGGEVLPGFTMEIAALFLEALDG